jgi:hypothetical protein
VLPGNHPEEPETQYLGHIKVQDKSCVCRMRSTNKKDYLYPYKRAAKELSLARETRQRREGGSGATGGFRAADVGLEDILSAGGTRGWGEDLVAACKEQIRISRLLIGSF